MKVAGVAVSFLRSGPYRPWAVTSGDPIVVAGPKIENFMLGAKWLLS